MKKSRDFLFENTLVFLLYDKKVCYNIPKERRRYRINKKPNPDLNSKTNRYTFKTPNMGISTINSKSVRLYLKMNMHA